MILLMPMAAMALVCLWLLREKKRVEGELRRMQDRAGALQCEIDGARAELHRAQDELGRARAIQANTEREIRNILNYDGSERGQEDLTDA